MNSILHYVKNVTKTDLLFISVIVAIIFTFIFYKSKATKRNKIADKYVAWRCKHICKRNDLVYSEMLLYHNKDPHKLLQFLRYMY